MIQKTVTPGTSAVLLSTLMGISQRRCASVLLQGDITNTGNIYIGTEAGQNLVLDAGIIERLYVSYRDIYVKGTGAGDKLVVTLE